MLNYLLSLAPFSIDDDVLGSWLRMMPITFAVLYVGTTFKGLSEITQGWNEVSTTNWVFLLLGFGISVILLVFITRIAKASQNNEQAGHAYMSSSLPNEMLPLVAGKESELVMIKIDPLREDIERKLMVTV